MWEVRTIAMDTWTCNGVYKRIRGGGCKPHVARLALNARLYNRSVS